MQNETMLDKLSAQLAAMIDGDIVNPFAKPAIAQPTKEERVNSILTTIKEENSNRMRCILTGAPYATLDDNEICKFILTQINSNTAMSDDNVIDAWSLTALSMASRVGPALQNQKEFTLHSLLDGTAYGYARLITFYMTRFFFDVAESDKKLISTRSVSRMHFASHWFDYLIGLEINSLEKITLRIAADDNWLPLHYWKSTPLFDKNATVNGLYAKKHESLLGWVRDPEAMPVAIKAVHKWLDSMIDILVASEIQGGVAHIASASKQSMLVVNEVANALSMDKRPVTTRFPVDTYNQQVTEYLEYVDTVTNRPIAKISWSRTHGKGYLPGEAGPKAKVKATTVTPATGPKVAKARKNRLVVNGFDIAAFNATLDLGMDIKL